MTRYKIGVDIGGTFTDLVVYDQAEGNVYTQKALTTPHDLSEGVMQCIEQYVTDFNEIDYFVHGTTSGLNAFLERKGAKVALLVTEGFRDVYEIGRANRVEMYNIKYKRPDLLLAREDIYEISERMSVDGDVLKEVNENQLQELTENLKLKGYDAVAVCFLHAYRNPENEKVVRQLVESQLDIPVSLSSDIAREWREYERVSTTVINAYIAPIVKKYLALLEEKMKEKGYEKDIYIMQSNGGVMTSTIAKKLPLQTLMSGPVGGTIGGISLAELTGEKNLICVDMGGTSFDVSMTIDGEPDVTAETVMEGFPILSPMVNIHTVGAGGGSIAYIEGGGLRVGPRSAGSSPGPACYGKGGTQPTVTDANVVLGRVDPDHFLGGDMRLDKEAAYRAVKSVADQIGLSVEKTAEGICDIANAKMADAIRTLTVKRGIDPREFTIVAFGGAGPMHAVLIAELLGVEKILVPDVSGTFSAWGMLQTDIRYDSVRNFLSPVDQVDHKVMDELYEEMQKESVEILEQQHIRADQIKFQKSADIRYVGQEYTVNIQNDLGDLEKMALLFHQTHFEIYGHNNPTGEIEIVNIRTTALGELEKINHFTVDSVVQQEAKPSRTRDVIWDGKKQETGIYNSEKLKPGNTFIGPAIVEDKNSTLVVPPSFSIGVDKSGNIEVSKVKVAEEELV